MLLGITFAWFTDSVTNKDNYIEAGELKAEFGYRELMKSGLHDPYTPITKETAPLFSLEGFVWEPGRSFGYDFLVTNVGSLAFEYEVTLGHLTGDTELADVLDVYWIDDTRAEKLENAVRIGTVAEVVADAKAISQLKLAPDQNRQFSLVVKMQEDAGNEYQGATVTFDIVAKARGRLP